MILMIDNYDSFTFNLVQYLSELGEQVEVARNDQISIEKVELMAPRAIVISPGPCTPNEAGISLELVEKFAGKFHFWVFALVIRQYASHLVPPLSMRQN